MADEKPIGCARPTGSVVGAKAPDDTTTEEKPTAPETKKETSMSSIMVGRPAPNFAAPAYYKGKFSQITLSDYLGKWIVLCFYPGDFTFV